MLDDEMKERIDATAAASARGRQVLIVLIIASVFVFSIWWNGRPDSWISANYRIPDAILRLEAGERVSDPDLARRARELQQEAGWSTETLEKFRSEYYKIWLDNTLVLKIPFFGVAIHQADVGLVGGFTFVVIMMWLIFSMGGERTNLLSTFEHARAKGRLDTVFELLAMRQVLTTPSRRSESRSRLWGKLPKALFALPLLSHSLYVYSDLSSIRMGYLMSPSTAATVLLGGLASWLLLLLLTVQAFVTSEKIDSIWKHAAQEI